MPLNRDSVIYAGTTNGISRIDCKTQEMVKVESGFHITDGLFLQKSDVLYFSSSEGLIEYVSNTQGLKVYKQDKLSNSSLNKFSTITQYGDVQIGSNGWSVWLHEAVKKAAEYHIMIDIHDEYRPTGFSRTYPNLMTQEGIRDNEEMPDATHNTILPFTRYLGGAGDYTICYYNARLCDVSMAYSHCSDHVPSGT
jgi:hypothetical protein